MSERETVFFSKSLIQKNTPDFFSQVTAICCNIHIHPRVTCNFFFIKKSWDWLYGGTNKREAPNEQCKGCRPFVLVFLLTLSFSLDLYPPLETGTKRRRNRREDSI